MSAAKKNVTIHEVKNRQTGTTIGIIQLAKPVDGNAWAADCYEHGARTMTKTRRDAHAAGRTPKAWCATCKKGATAKKITMPPPIKKAAAKKAAAKKAVAK